tara:strand:+ start:198 stop:587 length:390 start_codon:yes stop_codon:yes gene_type:complete
MSHFSTIKTKLRNKEQLQEALVILQYDIKEDQELKVTGAHGINHETVEADIAIGTDVGFRMNPMTGEYELVADLETWNQPITVERFMDKVSQQYAIQTVKKSTVKEGFTIENEIKNVDGSVELVVTRWT